MVRIEQLCLYPPHIHHECNLIIKVLYTLHHYVISFFVAAMSWLFIQNNLIPFALLLLCWCLFVPWISKSRLLSSQIYSHWSLDLLYLFKQIYICKGGTITLAIVCKKNVWGCMLVFWKCSACGVIAMESFLLLCLHNFLTFFSF